MVRIDGAGATQAGSSGSERNHVLVEARAGVFAIAEGLGGGLPAEAAAAASIRAISRWLESWDASASSFGPVAIREAFDAAARDLVRINELQHAYGQLRCRLSVFVVGATRATFGTHDSELHMIRDGQHRRFPVSADRVVLGEHPHVPPALLMLEHRSGDVFAFGTGPVVHAIGLPARGRADQTVERWLQETSVRPNHHDSALVVVTIT